MDSIEKILRQYNRLCWYPSAGADFRVLLFLSQKYFERNKINIPTDELPDLFILTDCNPQDIPYVKRRGFSGVDVLNSKAAENIREFNAYSDDDTEIKATGLRKVGNIKTHCDKRIYHLEKSDNFGCAFFFHAHIVSRQLGEWDADVLYILTENTDFALRYLIPQRINMDYIIRVRYGDEFGGSALSGDWLTALLPVLNVKYFLSTRIDSKEIDDQPKLIKPMYPDLEADWDNKDYNLVDLYIVSGKTWSDQGDIHWYRVES